MSKSIIIAALLFSFAFSNCKKGEDDPAISLLSRKTRLAGQWRLSSGKVLLDILNGKTGYHFDGLYDIDGTQMTGTETTLTTIAYVKGSYLLDLTIEKDGKFTFREVFVADILEAEGTWDFNNGVGEEKNKESVTFKIDHVSAGRTDTHLFNQAGMTFKYRLKELRDKKLAITSNSTVYSNTDGSTEKIDGDYTFVQ